MKKVIRYGVFETNSSSTHSLSIVNKYCKYKNGTISFEVSSPLAKTILILGLIDHAEMEFSEVYDFLESNDVEPDDKSGVINVIVSNGGDNIKEIEKKYGNIAEAQFTTLIKIVEEYFDFEDIMNNLHCYNNYANFVVDEIPYRNVLLRYREILIDAFCEVSKLSKEEALNQIYNEAYKNRFLSNLMQYSDNLKKDLEYYMENISLAFRCEYEKSEEKDIVKFAEKYLKDEINNEKKWRKGKISCCTYFGEGSMDECDCGFENFFNIFYELDLKNNMSDKKLKDHALNILSNKRKFVGKEYYCGRLEGVGEIY